jgi:plasmid stabilization system protein ParE
VTRYVLTSAAEADLSEIAEFIAIDSPQAALKVLGELRVATHPPGHRAPVARLV